MNQHIAVIEEATPDAATAQFDRLVRARRAVRGFLPHPVPDATLHDIFSLASRAPSNCNTQPWFVEVVSGTVRDRLSAAMLDAATRNAYTPDYPFDEKTYTGALADRVKDNAAAYYGALGIKRNERELRADAVLGNLRFFGAPHAAFLFMPDYGAERMAADLGMYAQTLLLTMQAHGIASCPQTILGFHAETVRDVLGIDPQYKLLFGISFGYEDPVAPANTVRTPRVDLDQTTHFHH